MSADRVWDKVDQLRARIAELEAEAERLRAEATSDERVLDRLSEFSSNPSVFERVERIRGEESVRLRARIAELEAENARLREFASDVNVAARLRAKSEIDDYLATLSIEQLADIVETIQIKLGQAR